MTTGAIPLLRETRFAAEPELVAKRLVEELSEGEGLDSPSREG